MLYRIVFENGQTFETEKGNDIGDIGAAIRSAMATIGGLVKRVDLIGRSGTVIRSYRRA